MPMKINRELLRALPSQNESHQMFPNMLGVCVGGGGGGWRCGLSIRKTGGFHSDSIKLPNVPGEFTQSSEHYCMLLQ